MRLAWRINLLLSFLGYPLKNTFMILKTDCKVNLMSHRVSEVSSLESRSGLLDSCICSLVSLLVSFLDVTGECCVIGKEVWFSSVLSFNTWKQKNEYFK